MTDAPAGDRNAILRHWRDAVPNDRLAHLIRDAGRSLGHRLTPLLAEHDIPFGHWAFLRVLWDQDGLTQKELSDAIGVTDLDMPATPSRIWQAIEAASAD